MRKILLIDCVILTLMIMTWGYFGLSSDAAVSFAMSLIAIMCIVLIS